MNKYVVIGSGIVIIGIALAAGVQALLRDEPYTPTIDLSERNESQSQSPPVSVVAGATVTRLESEDLAELLRQESKARAELEKTVGRLQKELEDLKLQVAGTASTPHNRPASTSERPASVRSAASRQLTASEGVFDEEVLRTAGLSSAAVAQIRERFEQLEMERLYLRDRARREGWIGTVRFSNEVAKLEESRQDVRASLGDPGYDAYLYATGQSNRVIIREMLQGSPAKTAGLNAGDVVLRYDGKRVFTTRELQSATTGGRAGESVHVEVLRNGQRIDVYVPRGPLGVYLDSDSAKP